jgi:hypothetical protein
MPGLHIVQHVEVFLVRRVVVVEMLVDVIPSFMMSLKSLMISISYFMVDGWALGLHN